MAHENAQKKALKGIVDLMKGFMGDRMKAKGTTKAKVQKADVENVSDKKKVTDELGDTDGDGMEGTEQPTSELEKKKADRKKLLTKRSDLER